MTKFNKLVAVATSFALVSAVASCTPTIGKGTEKAMTADGYDISSGLFIFYTIRAYQDAANIIKEQNGSAPTVKEVKNSHIDNAEAEDWIQNKAVEYCVNIAAIENEFDKIGGQLTNEELDEIDKIADQKISSDGSDIYSKNGVSKDSIKTVIEATGSGNNYYGEYEYMQKAIFEYYYGFDGEKGCSEDELKDYFDDNFARVKYISIDLKDENGDSLSDDDKKSLRRKAENYVKEINNEKDNMEKMYKMNECSEDYDEYISTSTTTVSGETNTVTTTTTTTTNTQDSQTTTTTDPYENEILVQKYTTTTASESEEDSTATTTTAEETDAEKADREYKQFVFDKLEMNKATLYEYDEDTLYVIIRGDLRERMTEDDFWSDQYIYSLQLLKYNDDFTDYMEGLAENVVPEKNNASLKRYSPFKLDLSSLEPEQ